MRVGTAIAILAMTACVDGAASGKPARQEIPDAEKQQVAALTVEISALSGVPPTEASLFSEMLKEEADRMSLPAGSGENGPAFQITGAMGTGEREDGTYVVAVIDIGNEKGERLQRVVNDAVLPERGNPGSALDSVGAEDLRRFAAATAGRIASWYAGTFEAEATMAEASAGSIMTGSISRTLSGLAPAVRFDVSVAPSPGDGASALANELDAALSRRIGTATWIPAGRYRVEGNVVTSSRTDGLTDVSIRWLVKSEDGNLLGEVEQENALDAAHIAGRWEGVARTASEGAAEGVLSVLQGTHVYRGWTPC
ncbi:MAG: hypothetical protein CVT81_08080 [Alphaproteobacteria bacterium HGW-Alphaproteobacteria-3]|nr:MAG: hypothetical protein CVT81_08080 [Alphaproteobacteria bacterium HGW-Alphaproteobacteria-3]